MDVSLKHSTHAVSSPESQRVEMQNNNTQPPVQSASSLSDHEIKQVVDKATGLLQTIVVDKLSDSIVRKMPADEYLHLLTLLKDIIDGSVDENV